MPGFDNQPAQAPLPPDSFMLGLRSPAPFSLGLFSLGLFSLALFSLALALAAPAALQAQEGPRATLPEAVVELSDEVGQRYASPGEDSTSAILVRPDGGFAIGGTIALVENAYQGWILDFDANALPTWSRLLAPVENAEIYDLVALADGDLLGIGYAESEEGPYRAAMQRFAPDGGLRWSESVDVLPGGNFGVTALELADGDILFGVTGEYEAKDGHPALLRLSADGQVRWQRPIEALTDLAALFVHPQIGIAALGGGPDGSLRLVGVDKDGDTALRSVLQTAGGIQAQTARPLPDGDIVLVGSRPEADEAESLLLRVAQSGELRWTAQIADGANWIDALAVAADGDLLVAGSVEGREQTDAFLGRITAEGRWLWARRFDGPRETSLHGIDLLPDGTILATGSSGLQREGMSWFWLRDLDAWLVALSPDGEPVALSASPTDPELRQLAQEMRLASRAFLSGAALEGALLHEMAPPAFHEEGGTLVMATAPLFTGPMMLNVARTRLAPAGEAVEAATVVTEPLLQAQVAGQALRAGAERQQINWRYVPGTFLAEAATLVMEGFSLAAEDSFRLEIARLDGRSESLVRADGGWDLTSILNATGIRGGFPPEPDAGDDALSPLVMAAERLVVTGETEGLDVQGYADALRRPDATSTPDLTAFAMRFSGGVTLHDVTVEDNDPYDGTVNRLEAGSAGVTVTMARQHSDGPADLRTSYDIEGVSAFQDGERMGTAAALRLALTGTAVDMEGLRREFDALDFNDLPLLRWDETDKLERILSGIGGVGLELSATDITVMEDGGGLAAARFELSLDGIRDNAATLRLKLHSDRIATPPGMMLAPADLEPQEIALEISLSPVPGIEILTALLAGDEFMLPGLLAQAAPVLEIATLALVMEAGEVRGDGAFTIDPESPVMAVGKLDVTVVEMERLRRRLVEEAPEDEGMMIGGFGGALDALAERRQAPDGRPANRFLVEALPDGTITVNGRPFPLME